MSETKNPWPNTPSESFNFWKFMWNVGKHIEEQAGEKILPQVWKSVLQKYPQLPMMIARIYENQPCSSNWHNQDKLIVTIRKYYVQ
jgi:hypothetical protein